MKTSREADLSSKDLNNILPSYLINEVQSIKSETEEKQSKMSDEINLFNIPIFNKDNNSNIETNYVNSPNSYKSLECSNDTHKSDNNGYAQNYYSPLIQNNSLDAKNEMQNFHQDINANNNNDDILNNNIFLYLNMNNKNVYNDLLNHNLTYLGKDNDYNCCNKNFFNNINNNQHFNINISFLNNRNYNNKSFCFNQTNQQKQYNINNNYSKVNNKNFLMNKINSIAYQEGNIINNYFNNINNINIISNNDIGKSTYPNKLKYHSNLYMKENYINYQNDNCNNMQNYNKNLDEFMKYINSLPMPLVNFLCTPKGISEIQKKLEKSNDEYKVLLVNILRKQGLSRIMKNTYGNYFFQNLIKKNEKSFIKLIISYIAEDLIDISKDYQGTFSLQALLDEISSFEEEQIILNCIKNYEMEMAFNKNATHVLQKIVLLFPDSHRIFLNEIILDNFIALSLDSNGICLIKIFIKTNTLINNKRKINYKIANNFVILSESPFGNYGVQYLMEIWNEEDLKDIENKIVENVYELSLQQFSSNVVEKAIEIFTGENREKILRKLCFEGNFIIKLLNNKFGKFVLNKAIKYMETDMINEFEINLNKDINGSLYKNKDKNKIKKLLMKIKCSEKKDVYLNDVNKIY